MRAAPTKVVRFLLMVALAAIVALAPPIASGSSKSVTLRLLFPTVAQSATDILIANFERQFPDIQISPQYLPSDQETQLLVTQFQAGNAPDIIMAQPGNM